MTGKLQKILSSEGDITGAEARNQRHELGLTQEQIADVAGVGVRTLRRLERNEGPSQRSTRQWIRGALHRAAEQRARRGRAA